MTVSNVFKGRALVRLVFAALLTLSAVLVSAPVQAASERALYLYYTHTKETARIVFKRNGQYVQSGLNELNYFLRDWRRNEPTQMDPRLFDLVWEVYQEVGGSEPVNVVSAYRSPATNEMLRETSSGVAENSQHTKGHAMDFFIPGISLSKLRAAAMRKQVGGVGYYPTSGSPFVHLDTGSVRAWPRMTRAQLKEIFPDGRTMHLPTDGTPLSQEGYQVAMNEWKRCHSYPCGDSSSGTQVAGGGGRTLVDMLFGGGNNAAPAPVSAAPQPTVQTAAAVAPQTRRVDPVWPTMRPADLGGAAPAGIEVATAGIGAIPFSTTGSTPLDAAEVTTVAVAMPVTMPEDLRATTARTLPSGDAVTALAALTAPTMPTPRVIMSAPPETLSAYVPTNAPNAGAQRALEMLLQENTPAVAAASPTLPTKLPALDAANGFAAAAMGGKPARPVNSLFEQTFGATQANGADPLAVALAAHVATRDTTNAGIRQRDLVAPDLDHVAEVFMAPAALESNHFAVIFDHDEADFDPTSEMGRHTLVKGVGDMPALSADRFTAASPSIN
ncbi:DUF882 domain-containing protein [Devosia rhizoryzae]|uniref:DUF882 domain-containing protein n=1 Tax=Devosia rhizoryzae TaxID=2774137 RepID=UPI001E5B1A8E|nr:DUF882 domain-containing protein [Devosia rhizoryzae]